MTDQPFKMQFFISGGGGSVFFSWGGECVAWTTAAHDINANCNTQRATEREDSVRMHSAKQH